MKEGWTYKKFKDICYSISDGDWIEKKDQSDSGIRLIQTGNIGVGVFIPKDDSHKYISEETFKRLKCTEIFEGDILISRLPNPLGRSCVLPLLETKCITAVDCSILKIIDNIVSPHFFVYYTQSQGYFSKINSESSGTTRARITRKKLEEMEIPVPSIEEQQRIVSRLDSAFAHIDERKANAEKQLSEARALFQKALTKAMEPKEGWEEKKLGEICQIKGGKRLPKGYVLSTEPLYNRYITVADFTINGTIIPSTVKYISEEVYKTIHRYTITSADVYVTIVGSTVGKTGIIPPELDGANLTENACKLVLNKDCDKRFVYYIMCSDYVIKQEQLLTKVSAQPKLALNRLASIVVYIPSLSEQQRIVSRLDSLSAHVRELEEVLQKTIAECDALKQALLRQVFE